MSIKTTQRITRERALLILFTELPTLPNDVVANLLDQLADSGKSVHVSRFDNFIVSDYAE